MNCKFFVVHSTNVFLGFDPN